MMAMMPIMDVASKGVNGYLNGLHLIVEIGFEVQFHFCTPARKLNL